MEESDQSVEISSDHPAIMPEKFTSEDIAQIEDENDYGNILLVHMMTLFSIVPMEPLEPLALGLASIFYVLFDALFLYVPLINEEMKCVKVDNKVKNAALVLRSFSDLRYLVTIIARIKDGRRESQSLQKIAKSIAVDIVSLLPIPQIVVLIFLPKMRGSISLKIMKLLNSLILLQYLARAYPLYRTCMRFNEMFSLRRSVQNETKYRGSVILINFIGFLLAGHVLGAFWYFFSVQREVDCWGYASRTENERKFSTSCEENAFRNVTLIHSLCPINPSDASVFDFGIFLYALQSGMQGSTNFPEKLLQCFSWGIRNLSSFASNLNTSSYGWENLFVVIISISGLMLFMYFLGNVQTLMQVANRTLIHKFKMEEYFIPRIQDIVSEYGLPTEMDSKLKPVVKQKLQEDDNYTVETLFSILSPGVSGEKAAYPANDIKRKFFMDKLKKDIKCKLFMDKLKKVDGLKNKEEQVLKKICEYLEPVMYTDGSYILREGEPLDMMFFVSYGSILTYATSNNGESTGSSSTIQLEKDKDDLFGEELLTWAQGPSSKLSNLPISPITVKAHTRVEIFLLKAVTLRKHFNFNTDSTTLTIAVENIEEVN